MPEAASRTALLRLMAWLSPAFPIGAFSYSSGLERAVHDGLVARATSLNEWLEDLLGRGSTWNDAVLFCEAWRLAYEGRALDEPNALAHALAGSSERHREVVLQGSAFVAAAAHWPGLRLPELPADAALPVAIGAVAGANTIPLEDACAAWLQSFVSGQIQAAIRLSVLGQNEAVGLLAALELTILATAERAARSTLDDLGSATIVAEIVSMKHETQYSRLFRS